ncbi:hypothetical protein GCM10023215_04180 [Pseudonocardia yuanmonensis]|uniref:Uncharacterized protein n=1 Tax=Pseudonocardia yuanmonensis TaxID=1095914 RepID=A0ABP8W057_9PSEU
MGSGRALEVDQRARAAAGSAAHPVGRPAARRRPVPRPSRVWDAALAVVGGPEGCAPSQRLAGSAGCRALAVVRGLAGCATSRRWRKVPQRKVPQRKVPQRKVPQRKVPQRKVPQRKVP